jgi:hypothetical protein
MMRVLVACEFSGVVRDAFKARGHDACSCDLLPSEQPGRHIQGDVLRALRGGWDLLIAHPPCTHLSVSGARWFAGRLREQDEAIAFFMELARAPIPRRCIENPIGIMSSRWRKPDQIVQPWQFGHDASKATCLWLHGLLPLRETNVLPGGRATRRANQTASGQNKLGPSPTRAADRARTYAGIAQAMAEQWG